MPDEGVTVLGNGQTIEWSTPQAAAESPPAPPTPQEEAKLQAEQLMRDPASGYYNREHPKFQETHDRVSKLFALASGETPAESPTGATDTSAPAMDPAHKEAVEVVLQTRWGAEAHAENLGYIGRGAEYLRNHVPKVVREAIARDIDDAGVEAEADLAQLCSRLGKYLGKIRR